MASAVRTLHSGHIAFLAPVLVQAQLSCTYCSMGAWKSVRERRGKKKKNGFSASELLVAGLWPVIRFP